MEVVAREGRPLVIFAEEVEGQALAALIMNTVRGTMKVAAVKAPRYGEERRGILQDLATSIGATFVSRLSGMRVSETKLSDLGSSDKIEITRYMTTIMGGKGDVDEIDNRINTLKSLLEENDNLHECERLQDRITKLASGVAVIATNAGTSPDLTVSRILSSQNNEGWDFSTGKFVDLFESGILDPAKVTRCALQNAASAAGTLLTANYAIVQDE